MKVIRTYKNASGEVIRVDEINMNRKTNTLAADPQTHTFTPHVNKTNYHGPASRDVASIDVCGDYDSIEGGTGNYDWASWTSPEALLNTTNLPSVGDTLS
jgi:hypothetical protein